MTTPEAAEDRLRQRLARYGTTLEEAAGIPAPRPRHLVVVDGPVGGRVPRRSSGPSSGPSSWRGPVGRVAAAVALLAVVAGATWAATRPTEPGTTVADRGWADGDVVRPEDRPSAFAALDGTWPLPAGGSLRFVVDRPAEGRTTFAAFRTELADAASCLWLRTAYEDPDLGAETREALAALPTWPGHAGRPAAARADLRAAADAALAGDSGRLRPHLAAECQGSGAGLGLPEIGRYWLEPGGPATPGEVPASGPARAVDPVAVPGGRAIVERLGARAEVVGALALPGGGYNIALDLGDARASLTVATVDGPVALPVDRPAFEDGYDRTAGGVEVYAGPVRDEDDATVVHAVGPGGRSIALSLGVAPDRAEDLLGDLGDLARDLHAAAWAR